MPQFDPKSTMSQYIPMLLNLNVQRERDAQMLAQHKSEKQIQQEEAFLLKAMEFGGNIEDLSHLAPHVAPGRVRAFSELSKMKKQQLKEAKEAKLREADITQQGEALGALFQLQQKGQQPAVGGMFLENLQQDFAPGELQSIERRGVDEAITGQLGDVQEVSKEAREFARQQGLPTEQARQMEAQIDLKMADPDYEPTPGELRFLEQRKKKRLEAAGVEPSPEERELAGATLRGATATLSSFSSMLDRAKELGPGAMGYRGMIGGRLGGYVAQLNHQAGQDWARMWSGATLEDLQAFRTSAFNLVAQAVPQMTGEESGRVTEYERTLADRALALKDPAASFPQVISALETVVQLSAVSMDKNARLLGVEPTFDLATDDGMKGMAMKLLVMGLSEQSAAETIRIIQKQRELLSSGNF